MPRRRSTAPAPASSPARTARRSTSSRRTPPNSGKSACGAGPCLDNWPAFTVDDASQLKADSGVSGKLDVITRDDGTKQVTYNGQPLYYFAGDTAAGTTNGAAIPNWGVANP